MRINHIKFIHSALFLALAFLTACGGGGGGTPPATTYTIGGTVTGLTGAGLVLQNNGGGDLAISANGSFAFATTQASSSTYQVIVLTHPSGQTCTVSSSSGTVFTANVNTVAVTCTTSTNTFTIGGTVTGLSGAGLVLQNNGGGDLPISANGIFAFATTQASGSTYQVTVLTQPSGQTCTVNSSSGTVSAANVNTVTVTCTTAATTYTIGGNVTGLTGTVVLQNNGGDYLSISANGTFVFATPQANSTAYSVTVLTQPAGQTCAMASGIGVVSGANVTTVSVTCSANPYTIGGTITGLTASGLVLLNNGGDTLTVSANATAFTFSTAIASGATYNVTIQTPPTGETCTVNPANGTVTSANITSVSVICSTASYAIGGTVSGLTGSGLVLQNNGGDDLTVAALASSYTFTTPLAFGSNYNITVKTQPTAPAQVCSVSPATGTVNGAITTANVTCVSSYTIGGIITGAADGIGPILQNNLGDNLFIPAITTGTTSFTFSTPIADLTTYSVTQLIRARAPYQNCRTITGGTGTVAGSNVTTVSITCSTVVPKFTYVTNSTANTVTGAADTVSAYAIGNTGALTDATTPPTTASGDSPYAVAVDPTGQFAYVVNSNADSVSVYGINPLSGVLTANQPSIATGDNPKSIAVHPSGKFAYVANQGNGSTTGNTLSAYGIDIASGALTAIDADAATPLTQSTIATGTFPYAVTVDPLGKFAYVANNDSGDVSVYTIDQITGALTAGTSVAAGTNPRSVAIDPTGKCALVASAGSDNIKSYMIDSVTGALTPAPGSPIATGVAPRSVAIDPNTGLYAYVANAGSSNVSAYGITLSTCAIAAINAGAVGPALTIAAGSVPISINVDPSGQFVYVANFDSNNVSVYSIGVGGALTAVAGSPFATGSGPTSVTTTQ